MSVIQEVLGSIRLIKAFGQENREHERFVRHSSKRMTEQVRLAMRQAVLDQAREIEESPHAISFNRAYGDFDFRKVTFPYDGSTGGLHYVSFHISAGTRVGIVGSTGAGKTTLLNLLMRFYDPIEGQVLLDGVDIREYRIADLRRQFSVALQEPGLFAASISENIAYGKRDASDEEIVAAAKAASSHEFISGLPASPNAGPQRPTPDHG
jgi:ATP-binding cassette subfamily B protein